MIPVNAFKKLKKKQKKTLLLSCDIFFLPHTLALCCQCFSSSYWLVKEVTSPAIAVTRGYASFLLCVLQTTSSMWLTLPTSPDHLDASSSSRGCMPNQIYKYKGNLYIPERCLQLIRLITCTALQHQTGDTNKYPINITIYIFITIPTSIANAINSTSNQQYRIYQC